MTDERPTVGQPQSEATGNNLRVYLKEMGAVPLVAAVCTKSYERFPVNAFFVRKNVKDHGAEKLIDGHLVDIRASLAPRASDAWRRAADPIARSLERSAAPR